MANEVTFEITKRIGVIKTYESGWSKEINMVSWNGNPPKVDIRDWSEEHDKMSRGITFTKDEFRKMIEVTKEKMPGLMVQPVDRGER